MSSSDEDARQDAEVQSFVALVEYDGTDCSGFQYQSDRPTVQGILEHSLGRFARLHGRIVGAGRTDAGVHARGQVIAGRVVWRHSLNDLQRAWNVHLPSSILIRDVVQEPATKHRGHSFHPRFSASSRCYRYTVVQLGEVGNRIVRSPLHERYSHVEPGRLDFEAMQVAAGMLLGTHDFATFGRAPDGESTIRTVTVSEWQIAESTPSPLNAPGKTTLVFTIEANAFLQHMVRRIVGTILDVGRHRMPVQTFGEVLAAQSPELSRPPAYAGGLVLERVSYSQEWGLTFHLS